MFLAIKLFLGRVLWSGNFARKYWIIPYLQSTVKYSWWYGLFSLGKIYGIDKVTTEGITELGSISFNKVQSFWLWVYQLPLWTIIKAIINNISYYLGLPINIIVVLFLMIVSFMILLVIFKFRRIFNRLVDEKRLGNKDAGYYLYEEANLILMNQTGLVKEKEELKKENIKLSDKLKENVNLLKKIEKKDDEINKLKEKNKDVINQDNKKMSKIEEELLNKKVELKKKEQVILDLEKQLKGNNKNIKLLPSLFLNKKK